MTDYTLLFQIDGVEDSCNDMQEEFGFVCKSIKETGYEATPLASNTWYDQDGEDVYIPSKVRYGGMDLEVELVYTGDLHTHESALSEMIQYLSGNAENKALKENGLLVYCPLNQRGYKGCYLKSVVDFELTVMGSHECFECKMVIRVTKPFANVVTGENTQNNDCLIG